MDIFKVMLSKDAERDLKRVPQLSKQYRAIYVVKEEKIFFVEVKEVNKHDY